MKTKAAYFAALCLLPGRLLLMLLQSSLWTRSLILISPFTMTM